MPELLTVEEDRMCQAWALDNPLRRTFVPARRDLKALGLRPGQTVVDLGTGVGFLLPEILRDLGVGGRVLAVDIDEENLEVARKRVASDPRVTFHVGSAAERTPFPDGSADRVLLSLVLCCLVDKSGALAEAWRLLRPGGLLLASYPRWGEGPRRSRRPLRVTPELWDRLVRERPWEELPRPRGRWVLRHLIRKPQRPIGASEEEKK
ncbi:MAG: class I SAM-dependent methyltransferase [Euryarchaeota archaeon]|nr:class I SAM-dependent methyltransferase [Euryarchaeota archaeon]MDE1838025.1 class I SAM-dependent methyltransferase [Euryarchaeota archaeon]MDE1880120.1 class I SAM-dependent methyltransferase [Euryarchaeota archaeon]MDE2045042.1 class I SAM-dependent methyltransferase [Thermoplasmata archaeon]